MTNGFTLDEERLLGTYRQSKDLEIRRLLTQYGTSLSEVREMYPQLTGAIEQRRLAITFPTQELFFTSTEAQEMGLSLPEGWMLKLSPTKEGGLTSSFITEKEWEIGEDFYIAPSGERYTRADIEALLSEPVGGLETTPYPLAIENLTEEGQGLYQEYQEAGGELGIEGWIDLRERQQLETEQVFGRVFPEQDINEVIDYINEQPEAFLADIREIGRTEQTEALLRSVFPEITEQDFQDIFLASIPGVGAVSTEGIFYRGYIPEHWLKDAADALLVGGRGFVYGQRQRFTSILPALFAKFLYTPAPTAEEEAAYYAHMTPPEPSPLPLITQAELEEISKEAATLPEEYLELFKDIPSIQRLSDTDIEMLRKLKSALNASEQHFIKLMDEEAEWHLQHPELAPPPQYLESPWENPELFRDPGYISYTISSSLVYSVSVMATLITVSSVASPTAGVFAALEVAAGPESTSMTEELVRQGVPFEDAIRWGELYGHIAGGIETVSDLPFVGLIFKPIGQVVKPMWNTIFRGVANRLVKRILTGLMIPQFEGLEEIVTQVVHNAILKHYDETQSILEGVSHAYIQGVIASTPFGAIGGYASFNTFYDRLSPQVQQQYDALVDRFQNAGLTKQQAQVQAANELAKTPEGEAELSEAIEAAQEEYWAEHGPAPQPIIPELAEGVLQEIEVTQEITKRVTPVTPEVTYAGLVKEINAPEGWKVSIYGENADGTHNVRVVPKEGESVVINNYDRAKPFIEQYQEALRVQQEIGTKGVEVAKARPQKPFMPEAVTPTVPEAEGRQFVGITRSTDPTQSKSPWRVAYTLKGKEYAGHFSSKVKAIEYAKDKLGLDIDPKTLQPIAVPEAVREEVAAEAPYEVRRRYDLLTHLTRAKQKESTEHYLFNEFGEDIVVNAANEGLITRSPKRIYTITIKGRDAITAFEEGIWGREFLVTLAHLDTGKRTTTKVRAADELEAGRKSKAQMQAGPRWVVDKVTIPKPKVPTTEVGMPEVITEEEFNRLPQADLWNFGRVLVKTRQGILRGEIVSTPRGFKGKNAQIKLETGKYISANAYEIHNNIKKALPEIPKAAIGMPEAGLQPSMLEEVPAKEVRPEARGKLVQSRIDDYLKLRDYNKERATDRISEIRKILGVKGRTPKGEATKGNLRLELARLEALKEVEAVEIVEELDRLIREVGEELGLRSMPYAGYGGKSHMDLVRHPPQRYFKEYTATQLEEMMKVYEQARQAMSPEVSAVSPIRAEDITTDLPALTNVALTSKQVERTIELFKEAVAAPNIESQRVAALELRKHVFAERAKLASESAEAMIAEGMNPEEAIRTAEQQFMTGKLPDLTTDYFSDLTQEMRNVLFAKVYNYWKGKSWTELISTFEALTNALAGQSIPRIKGIGTKYFPDGGSAWDRLVRVFIGDMEVLETLDQGKSLSDIIEGVLLETGRGSVPLNQETVNWLKTLSTISEEDRLLLEKPLSEITEAEVRRIAQSGFYGRRNELNTLLKDGVISQEEYKLQLAIAKDKAFPHKPIEPGATYPGQLVGQPRLGEIYTPPERLPEARTPEEIRLATFDLQRRYREATEKGSIVESPSTWAEYNKAFKELPLLTFKEKGTIIRTLKSIGMTIIDIGNLVRANKASFDFSFWRQARALAAGHPVAFYRANIEAWKALWSQAHAEANWQWITRDPDYELYEQIRVDTGADPLRIFEAPKGTAQWRAAEEMGYLTGERAIPRFTARIPWIKVSGRSFVVGTNTISWLVWKKCLAATRARAMRIASSDIILPEGEGFSISAEMTDYQKYIADAVQRASLGKAAPLAPALSSMFFAPRSKLARLLYPRHLVSSNPRVRALAWKDFSLFVGTISSLVMLGYWLGLWDVERDPRNAEFMSIRIGNMRIDPWAGHRQFIVLYARLTTGTGLSSVTGQEYEVNPIGALTTFFRTSLSPLSSILLDFWTGKNFLGEELDIADPEQWLDRIAPFAIQDVWEAFQDDWQNGLIAILPAIVGEGVQTYTGDWNENWLKLGLPKYPENTGYGIDEPVYDLSDFWADTAARFRGVDPATLTESKGFPEYVRSVATALQVIEQIGLLPNKRLTSINVDAEEGATFKDYYQMWQDRQIIVASGDDEALKAFDADERTRNAYLGNMTQAQYALLMEYHSLPESEKAEFLGNHPGLYGNPREDWLRSHPEENALLALWGKSKIYSLDALSKLDSLATSLGIPENALIERDLDAVAQLRIKHDKLYDLLDVYGGLDDEVKDDEGLTARDRAIEDLYTNNPDFRDDMRRIEALSQGTEDEPTPEEIVEGWVNRGIIVDEYGAGSAEAKLWLIDNQETHQWALDNALLSDDGTDWNEPILRLLVQYGDDFDLYEAYGDTTSDNYISDDDQRAEARHRLLFDDQENMTSFGKAYYTRDASSQGYSESNWNAYVEYAALPIWGSWRERFLLDNADFYKEYIDTEIGNHPLVDETRVKPVARDRIYQQFYDEFQAWDDTGGIAPKAIENMRAELDNIERGGLTFTEAKYSVQAYDNGFPENLIDDYVGWYSTARKDYEDDWWLMEHPEFYKAMYDLDIWTDPRDFSKVPSREVYALYQTYQGLPSGTPRLDFRAKHPELDAWLVLAFGYKPVKGRGDAEAEPTPWEELAQVKTFQELFGHLNK